MPEIATSWRQLRVWNNGGTGFLFVLQPRNACSDDDDVETDHWIARLNRSYERMGPASSNSFFPPPRRVYSERVRGGMKVIFWVWKLRERGELNIFVGECYLQRKEYFRLLSQEIWFWSKNCGFWGETFDGKLNKLFFFSKILKLYLNVRINFVYKFFR